MDGQQPYPYYSRTGLNYIEEENEFSSLKSLSQDQMIYTEQKAIEDLQQHIDMLDSQIQHDNENEFDFGSQIMERPQNQNVFTVFNHGLVENKEVIVIDTIDLPAVSNEQVILESDVLVTDCKTPIIQDEVIDDSQLHVSLS